MAPQTASAAPHRGHEESPALPPRPAWLPTPDQLQKFYGETLGYPFYRLQVTDYIARLLPEGSLEILDVGSGDGYLGALLQTHRPRTRVTGVETQRRDLTYPGFEPIIYDGLRLPFADRSFDVAIVTNVLHHTDDQLAVLAETCRVTRQRVIVKDHLARHRLDRWKLAVLDILGNRRFGADTQGDYLDRTQWAAMFSRIPRARTTRYEGLTFRKGALEKLFGNELEIIFALDVA